jgi:F-type H+-transporting ATPase subunit a
MLKLSRLGLPALIITLAILAGLIAGLPEVPGQEHPPGHGPGHVQAGQAPAGHTQTHPAPAAGEDKNMMIELIAHVLDGNDIHLFDDIWPYHIPLPEIFGGQLTKFGVIEVLACLLIVAIYVPLAHRVKNGEPAHGWFWNTFEVLLTFVRDQIAKPSLGDEQADRYVPFLWTMFLFILFNNLLGMVPFLGSPTADIFVTGALALIVFFAIHGSAIMEMARAPAHGHDHDERHGHDDHGHHVAAHGPAHEEPASLLTGLKRYIGSNWPEIDMPNWPMGLPIKTLVFCLEIMGILVRNGVLAIRLFANMFAGHMVLATILFFVYMARNLNPVLWGTITISSVAGIVALSLLEIFVAFLQAYIFTFLTALFMGMAMNPQH